MYRGGRGERYERNKEEVKKRVNQFMRLTSSEVEPVPHGPGAELLLKSVNLKA